MYRPKIYEYFKNSKEKNTFYATYDDYAYTKADIIIVDINLDVNKNKNRYGQLESYDINLKPFQSSDKKYCRKM